MVRTGTNELVKSAGRAVQILDLFQRLRRPLSVMQIATNLEWPASSTFEVAQTLVALGYLTQDQASRTYFPSRRVALLGDWLSQSIFLEGSSTKMMIELSDRTNDTIILAVRKDDKIEIVDAISSMADLKRGTRRGDIRSVITTTLGHTLLASYEDSFVEKLVRRINAYQQTEDEKVSMSELRPVLREIRHQGYAYTERSPFKNGGLVAMLLPAQSHEDRMAVGVAGPLERIRSRRMELVRILRETVRKYAK
jgi:DNA-binding IclR family transcriptional regulator